MSAGLCPMGCNCDPNGPNMDRNLGLHILSHSAHIGVHGEPFGSYLGPFPHPSECTGAHSDRNCVPFSTHREAGVLIRIAIASDSAPTGVYGSQFLTSPKKWHNKKTHVFSGFGVPNFWDGKNLSQTMANQFPGATFSRSSGRKTCA